MQAKSCPISFELIDANIVRINSFYVGLVFILFLLTQNSMIIFFLVLDFIIRIFIAKEYSLLIMLSKITKKLLDVSDKMEDFAPKRLASYFGLLFTLGISMSTILGFTFFLYLLSTIFLLCIVLEVAFSYCLGCEVYHFYKKFSL
jgi:hypothetical protein